MRRSRSAWPAAPLGALAPNFPVPAGGVSVERVPELLERYGRDVILRVIAASHRIRASAPHRGDVVHPEDRIDREALEQPLLDHGLRPGAARFAELLSSRGISNDTTVVFYGDKNNWWATYALIPS
jgi:hypothetical protein